MDNSKHTLSYDHGIGDAVVVSVGPVEYQGTVRGLFLDENNQLSYRIRTVSPGGISDDYYKASEVAVPAPNR